MKAVFVTGISRGIGLEIAKVFSKDGYHVYGSSRSNFDLNKALNTDNAKHFALDVNDRNSINDIFSEIAKSEFILECLINNAGITKDNLAIRMNFEEWKKVLDINLTSTFLMSKFAIKKMLKNKSGKIVNITSVVGHTGNVGQVNYAASKSGIIGMSKSLALEYAKKNININCISPGFIRTNMTDKIDPKFKELILAKIPSNKLGEPADVANVA